jgi:hypothetical protein
VLFPQEMLNLIVGLGILIGAAQCFFGYRIFKLILCLTGFIIGGVLAGYLGYGVSGGEEAIAFLLGIIGGFIGAALAVAFYLIGVFLIGAFLGGLLGGAVFAVSISNPEPAILLILAVISGVLTLIFQKFMIILSTSFAGAWSVVIGIVYFTARSFHPADIEHFFRSVGTQHYAILLCWITLGITGFIVQYKHALTSEKQLSGIEKRMDKLSDNTLKQAI